MEFYNSSSFFFFLTKNQVYKHLDRIIIRLFSRIFCQPEYFTNPLVLQLRQRMLQDIKRETLRLKPRPTCAMQTPNRVLRRWVNCTNSAIPVGTGMYFYKITSGMSDGVLFTFLPVVYFLSKPRLEWIIPCVFNALQHSVFFCKDFF